MHNRIIYKYYPEDNALRNILITHSTLVMKRAVRICDNHPELKANRQFIIEAAMLHDLGIFKCNAPSIHCMGNAPYICHGYIGGQLMRAEGYPMYARVCERHTGAGITRSQIINEHLPLPENDFLPETIEEKIICYADKFYSKSHPEHEKSYKEALKSLSKFGEEGILRFMEWKKIFE